MGGLMGGGGSASKAASAQIGAANQGLDLQKQIYNESKYALAPWTSTGTQAQNQLAWLLGLSDPTKGVGNQGANTEAVYGGNPVAIGDFGALNQTYTGQDLYDDPGYQFRLDKGQKALERSQAAKAGLLSGAALKASQTYGQNMGSQEFGAARSRFNEDQSNLFNRLMGVSGTGQQAVNTNISSGQNYANQATDLYSQIGNAQAAKAASSSSWASGLGKVAGLGLQAATGSWASTPSQSSFGYSLW